MISLVHGMYYKYIGENINHLSNGGSYKFTGNNSFLCLSNGRTVYVGDDLLIYFKEVISDNNNINPKHYSFNIKGTPCDLFDIGNAMDLNKEQFTALRYFRKKENQIEDTKKAIKCLERLVERLEAEKND